MILEEMYKSFVNSASIIPNFVVGQKEDVPYDITELADNYCKACDEGNENLRNAYISALMVRYWHMIPLLYEQSKSCRVEMEDMVSWVYESFEKAFQYRSWKDSSKEISKDPKGAEKCFNQCITSTRQRWYKHFNQKCRRGNFVSESLDEHLEKGDSVLFDNEVEDNRKDIQIKMSVSSLVEQGRLLDAIVVDAIAYQDVFVENSTTINTGEVDEEGEPIEYTKCTSTFSEVKLGQHLKSINDTLINYYVNEYGMNREEVSDLASRLGSYNRNKLRSMLVASLERIRHSKELLSLC